MIIRLPIPFRRQRLFVRDALGFLPTFVRHEGLLALPRFPGRALRLARAIANGRANLERDANPSD